jgi:hypothetical protein
MFTVFSKQLLLFCCPIKHQNETEISNDASRMPLIISSTPLWNLQTLKPVTSPRYLYVKNSSLTALSLVWHVFVKQFSCHQLHQQHSTYNDFIRE